MGDLNAKWYADWIRLLPASTAEEKMRNLEAADMLEELEAKLVRRDALLAKLGISIREEITDG